MPKILRENLPVALVRHLRDRVRDRGITREQLLMMMLWLDANPEVPAGRWFKRFAGMTVCGEGVYVKTLLRQGQVAAGEEVL